MPIKNPLGLGPGLPPGAGFFGGYSSKVLSVEPASLIGYWPQNEPAGSVSFDGSGKNHHGAYTGVTLGSPGVPGMGFTAPTYDGVEDYNNIYSASLNTAFNGAEGTLLAWAKVSGAGVWTDSTRRYMVRINVDANNFIYIRKSTINNQITFSYEAGGTAEAQAAAALTNVDFAPYGMTWDISAGATGEVHWYLGGVPNGTLDVGLGTWVGDLSATEVMLGADDTTPAAVWSGDIGPVALWNTALSADQIAYLSKV